MSSSSSICILLYITYLGISDDRKSTCPHIRLPHRHRIAPPNLSQQTTKAATMDFPRPPPSLDGKATDLMKRVGEFLPQIQQANQGEFRFGYCRRER